ncbi:MAG: hypothetical protein FWE17_01625 [Alphaproteobacteria bacterium]|nr:hypothetical protein [Alphaproteobacteria bacterium]MCL2758111.1 hypothetical protein [Alphaproteobacteria bacterium]
MSEIKIFAGNSFVRNQKTRELYEEDPKDAVIIIPGHQGAALLPSLENAVTMVMSNFKASELGAALSVYRRVIVSNAHTLSADSADNLIRCAKNWQIDLYLLSAKADMNNVPYPILRHLSDSGYDIHELDNFGMPQATVQRASDLLPPAKEEAKPEPQPLPTKPKSMTLSEVNELLAPNKDAPMARNVPTKEVTLLFTQEEMDIMFPESAGLPIFKDVAHISKDAKAAYNIVMRGVKSETGLSQKACIRLLNNLACIKKTAAALEKKTKKK